MIMANGKLAKEEINGCRERPLIPTTFTFITSGLFIVNAVGYIHTCR